jgi:hypothetical protein
VTTTLTLDARAADCASASGFAKPGFRPLSTLMSGKASRGTPPPVPNRLPAEVAFAGLLLAGFVGRYARRFRSAAWMVVLAVAGLALSACGSSSVTSQFRNPSRGTYTISITGADSATSTNKASTTFTFTIN